jgi:hypothetical protein
MEGGVGAGGGAVCAQTHEIGLMVHPGAEVMDFFGCGMVNVAVTALATDDFTLGSSGPGAHETAVGFCGVQLEGVEDLAAVEPVAAGSQETDEAGNGRVRGGTTEEGELRVK